MKPDEIDEAQAETELTADQRTIRKLKDQNRTLRKKVEASEREAILFDLLRGEIDDRIDALKPYKPVTRKQLDAPKHTHETPILSLSDIHGTQIVLPERVQGLEDYNFHVTCKRAEVIVDSTISFLFENMSNYIFEELWIFVKGDLTPGEIHGMTQHTEYRNDFKNAMAVGELLAQMVQDLLRYFKVIRMVAVPGNHGRRSRRKDYHGAHNNWDYLTMVYARARLLPYIEEGRLEISIPDTYTVGVCVLGWNHIINHGDDIRSWNSIPWYGIERKTRRMTALSPATGIMPHYFWFGHFHQDAQQQHPAGETFINGKWLATDEFAVEAMAGYSEPRQWLVGVHKNRGVSWRVPLQLRVHNWKKEEKKPSRYKVEIP